MQDDEAVGRARDYRLRMPKQPRRESARGDGALARALALVRDLRARCPWDRAQTRETLRPYLVEEALELDQALRDGAPAALREEHGDLLLHLRAYRVQERAAGVGFDWPDAKGPMQKVKEEIGELEVEMRDAGSGMRDSLQDEIGDLLFAVVNLARKLAIDPRAALERANDKFQRRFEAVERLAEQRGVEIGHAGLDELDKLWDEVKAQSL